MNIESHFLFVKNKTQVLNKELCLLVINLKNQTKL